MSKLTTPQYRAGRQLYMTGFVLSLLCTIVAYALTVHHTGSGHAAISHAWLGFGLITLALTQFIVQLIFFLHMGDEVKPRLNLLMLGFMVVVVLIVVLGTLWIMANLSSYHQHLTPEQTEEYIFEEEGIQP